MFNKDMVVSTGDTRMSRGSIFCMCALSVFLAGCQTDIQSLSLAANSESGPPHQTVQYSGQTPTLTVQDPAEVKYYPSDQPLRLALENFKRGNFGLAARYFEDATVEAPKDATAWVGLAASYDRIGRFDLSDRAYKQAVRLEGETTQILNNEGYSYMLRGNFKLARHKFLEAYERDPHNPIIINNLKLLNSSARFIQRQKNLKGL